MNFGQILFYYAMLKSLHVLFSQQCFSLIANAVVVVVVVVAVVVVVIVVVVVVYRLSLQLWS